MPLKIDISDVTIDRFEPWHHLHIWGLHTTRFDTNCLGCGRATSATRRIRCRCGDGYYCSRGCRTQTGAQMHRECAYLNRVPLSGRPSARHRRAVVLHRGAPSLSLVWVEVRDGTVVIDHGALQEAYREPGDWDKPWLDLAVINPAVPGCELFRKLGHGIAMGCSSMMLDPKCRAKGRERNTAVADVSPPGHRNLWPHPLVFFCFGYDMGDYVKVDPRGGGGECGVGTGMTAEQAWDELDRLRWHHDTGDLDPDRVHNQFINNEDYVAPFAMLSRLRRAPPADPAGRVWKWRVKERGTSMRVLDLTHRDLNVIFEYLACTRLNPAPATPVGLSNCMTGVHVRDPNHVGYEMPGLWDETHGVAELFARARASSSLDPLAGTSQEPIFKTMIINRAPAELCSIAGAAAVGLRYVLHYSTDINAPFRAAMPKSRHGLLTNFLWSLDIDEGQRDALVKVYIPSETCDSVIVMHGNLAPIPPHHLRALWKYLEFTPPRAWSRQGPKGFEAYWKTYARIYVGPNDAADSPYVADTRFAGAASLVDGRFPSAIERIRAHMTLENLGVDEWHRDEIVRRRDKVLGMISFNREKNRAFPISG